ncbi:MAG TPA: bifunctional 5,10-methylenetetrahydrofolate dehydrogenase/5,10-methenyltetrahydrofolate cyclohydrolase, partial [Actinomycetes bacterium]|nr:bifunctional 5,10-methylenetetrahydrofolate dehydrogenase/5,10-methenyltetrahydrofolate cyclohydrolase [Actinomycetes bacterium]
MDGKAVAARLQAELAGEVERLAAAGARPGLAAVLVGDDEASHIYVGAKQRAGARWGIDSRKVALPADATQEQVLGAVAELNADPTIHGIIVQLPLPDGVDPVRVQEAIDPTKDVDGLHPWNEGRVLRGDPGLAPCTAVGIVELLRREKVQVEGAHVVIVGRGLLVGRPLAVLLSLKAPGANATVTVCHTATRDLARFTTSADVLVAAAGVPAMITPEMVKPGAAVVDCGNHRVDGRLVGDVAPAVAGVAGALTPVPGGVGPMTVAMLMANTITAASERVARAVASERAEWAPVPDDAEPAATSGGTGPAAGPEGAGP